MFSVQYIYIIYSIMEVFCSAQERAQKACIKLFQHLFLILNYSLE